AREQNGHSKSLHSTIVTLACLGPKKGDASGMLTFVIEDGAGGRALGAADGAVGEGAFGAAATGEGASGARLLTNWLTPKPMTAPTISATMIFGFIRVLLLGGSDVRPVTGPRERA